MSDPAIPPTPQIVYEPVPSEADMRALGEKLNAYNEARAGPLNYERMFFTARDANGELVGGLLGAT
jgi:hypothetical protein